MKWPSRGDRGEGERRIFNILINSIPHTDWADSGHWTEPLAGTIGFCGHDGNTANAFGDPIEPVDRKRFDELMRPIVDAATRLLQALPRTAARPTEEAGETPDSATDIEPLPTRDQEFAYLDRLLAEIEHKDRLYAPLRGIADIRPADHAAALLAPWDDDEDIALLRHHRRRRESDSETPAREYDDIPAAFGDV